ncbi:MAG: carbohydrate kinase, partial [Gammaproteobacteria bacterium]|nr:carbohydrate kinase [Gammaproteobacteria bacterium]
MSAPTLLCAGEALWDILPRGEFMGGAPFNVAAHAARLGARALLAARFGDDERGRRALELARGFGIDTSLVQLDAALP